MAIEAVPDSIHGDGISMTETVGPSGVADQPTTSDSLGFTPYVQAVSAFLTHEDTKPPLTISVEGPWGSGKSSFMRQLQLEIQHCLSLQNRVARTVWFNAWRQNKDEELWAAFALHFSEEVLGQLPWVRRHGCHIKLQWLRLDMKKAWFNLARFTFLFSFFIYASVQMGSFIHRNPSALSSLTQASGTASQKEPKPDAALLKLILASLGSGAYIFLAFMFLKKVSEVVGNPLKIDLEKYVANPKYDNRVAFIDTFQSDFRKMVKCFSREETIFVFIDDLDRCEVPKSAELMHALNLLISDSPNVVYILGLDREKIAAGIAAKFHAVLPYLMKNPADASEALDFGFNYLEKFLQVPFQVPRPSLSDVDRLMKEINNDGPGLKEDNSPTKPHVDPGILFKTKADSELVREIVRMVTPAFEFNPRRIKQFVNCFRVQAIIASQTGMFGHRANDLDGLRPLSPQHLGKLIAICLRWPRFLNVIAEDPQFLDNFPYSGPGHSPSKVGTKEYWSEDSRLTTLVRFREGDPSYDMRGINIGRFLTIAPKIRQPRYGEAAAVAASGGYKSREESTSTVQSGDMETTSGWSESAKSSKQGDFERDWDEEGAGIRYKPRTNA